MDNHLAILKLPPTATLEEAREAYYTLAEQYHADNITNVAVVDKYRHKLEVLDQAWLAIQVHFHSQDTTFPPNKQNFEWYHSKQELYKMAVARQEHRREQPRGALRLSLGETQGQMPVGLYEEYERVRQRNRGYIFEGEATVLRSNNVDVIHGAPTFQNTIFTTPIQFQPKKQALPERNTHGKFAKPGPAARQVPPPVFMQDTVFMEKVQFDVPAVFEGNVEFKKHAIFNKVVTFYERPVASIEGVTHGAMKEAWRDA